MANQIEGLMNEAMGKLRQMIDVDTVVGQAITVPTDDPSKFTTVIPVSKVSFGFGAGGSEFAAKPLSEKDDKTMFGGGCGGGVSVKPMAFLVVKDDNIRLLPVTNAISTADRIIDMVPEVLDKFNSFIKGCKSKKDKNEESVCEQNEE